MPLSRCDELTRWGHPASRQPRNGWHFGFFTAKEGRMNTQQILELAIVVLKIFAAFLSR